MPNIRGGKGYKKGKKNPVSAEERAGKFSGLEDDQIYGRAVRLLGNRRIACFCGDGIERVCKIRGALCNKGSPMKQKILIGDIVVLSGRDFEKDPVMDIIDKVPRTHWKYIKQDKTINPQLFADENGEDGLDDLFEDQPEEDTAGGDVITHVPVDSDGEVDVDAI